MIILFSGGSKSGKSELAEDAAVRLAGDGGRLYYIATMIPRDDEDLRRIEQHRTSRAGKGFITVECGGDINKLADDADPEGTYLLDSVTALLESVAFDDEYKYRDSAADEITSSLKRLSRAVKDLVLVSDNIFSDKGPYDAETEKYRRGLAACGCRLAEISDTVCEVTCKIPMIFKGELPL